MCDLPPGATHPWGTGGVAVATGTTWNPKRRCKGLYAVTCNSGLCPKSAYRLSSGEVSGGAKVPSSLRPPPRSCTSSALYSASSADPFYPTNTWHGRDSRSRARSMGSDQLPPAPNTLPQGLATSLPDFATDAHETDDIPTDQPDDCATDQHNLIAANEAR